MSIVQVFIMIILSFFFSFFFYFNEEKNPNAFVSLQHAGREGVTKLWG